MKVDVLMATYNRSQKVNGVTMVERAIESFLKNDYKESNLIILNDASTDNTKEILSHYKGHERIKIFNGDANKLPPNNWNWLWEKAESDIICQLHDDDELTESSLSLRVEQFKKNKSIEVVYGGVITQNIQGEKQHTILADEPNKERILKDEYINFTTLMYKRGLSFKFDAELRYYFDWLFKIRCLLEYNVGYVKEPVMIYTVHQGQETNKCRREKMNDIEEVKMRIKLKELYK